MSEKFIYIIRLFFALITLPLIIISCEEQKENTDVLQVNISGRWNHVSQVEDSSVLADGRAEYSLALFTDSTYYLTQSITYEHSSGQFLIKKDTLILYKNVLSAENFTFIYELKKDTLLLHPINENDRLKYKDFIGYWLYD